MKKILTIVLSSLMCLSLVACGTDDSSSTTTTEPTETEETTTVSTDDIFDVVLTTAPVGFDPIVTNDSASAYINTQIYETLYRRTMDGLSYEPLLAESLPECNEEGTVCTIKLKEGITFSNGEEFNAETVKYTIDKIKDPETGSGRASIVASIEEAVVIDDTTLELHLSYPDGVLVAKFAHSNSAIVAPIAYESQDFMTDPIGTGPYVLVSSISGSEIVLASNENYWGGTPEVTNAKFTVITDPSTALARLETGEADFIATVPETSVSRVENISGYTTVTKPSSAIVYLAFRNNSSVNPIMAEENLRIAIIESLDMDAYVESVLGGLGSHSQSILGPTVFGYTDDQESHGYTYDLEDAKKLIEDGGYADEEINFLINNRSTTVALAEFMQASLTAAGLTNVNIIEEEWATFLSDTKIDNYWDMTILTWSNLTGDGTEFLEPNVSSSSSRMRYENDEFDELVAAGKMTLDTDERLENLEAANNMCVDDAVVSNLYNSYQVYTYNNQYGNIALDAGGEFYLNQITINK